MLSAQIPGSRNAAFLGCLLTTLLLLFFIPACNKKTASWKSVDPAYSKYVEAYTTGVISKTAAIRVQLAANASTTHSIGEEVKEKLFTLSPSVKGKTIWVDARTIEFKPEKNLTPDQLYEVKFALGKVTEVPEAFSDLVFNFQTTKPAFIITNDGLRSSGSKDKMFIEGTITTADAEEEKEVQKILTVHYNNQTIKSSWQHSNNNKTHRFTIAGISRGTSGLSLYLKWNGAPLSINKTGVFTAEVPAIGDFKLLQVVAVNDAQQFASVQFSDPIANDQDLTGLLSFANQPDVSYSINGSEVKLFAGAQLDGSVTVNTNAGIRNKWGQNFALNFTSNIVFENRMPSVRIIGKGNILPNSGKLVLPFDAVNLNAVDISILKIYENNVPQFFQDNDMGGNNELRKVAKPIVQKTLRLDDDKTLDLHIKQRFSLDIDRFLKTEPGAIYTITIGFRPQYSTYSKTSVDTTSGDDETEEENERDYYDEGYYTQGTEGKDDFNRFWENYDNYYPYGYNWSKRDDPTSRSYYNKDRWATRNIIASNIGLTAKRGSNNSLLVAVSDILSTEPVSGVELNILDYQHQVIAKSSSGSDGFATIDLQQKPYLLIAKKGKERGYLKLDDGSALPLSRFDISGEAIKNGIKGFIFGERGVWRPGDSIYLNCIIEDKTGSLPKDHPVEFTLYTPQGQVHRQAIQTNGMDGFYVFKTATEAAAPTGNWLAKIKVGGAVFEKRIKIETVMPNRLKINLDFGKENLIGIGSAITGTINAAWLFGSPGKNLKAKIDASLNSRKTVFEKFSGFSFDNPATTFSTQSKTIFEGTLDENGSGIIKPAFQLEEAAPGMLTANLLTKVFEPGGSFSINYTSLTYSPFSSYAGIKMPQGEKPFDFLLAGKQHNVQIVDVDNKGNLLAGRQPVEIMLYKIQWRWWWEEGSDNLSNFTQNEYNKLIKKEDILLTNGRGQWQFSTGVQEWGRYLVLVKDKTSGHTTGSVFYVDEPGWQSRSGQEDQSAAAMLSFSSNKEKYNVGEEVTLTIPSARGGRILLSLENGSHVIKNFWQETTQGQTQVKFKVEPGMAPNVFATVSLLQPHPQSINDLPIRMYGTIPILIEDKNTVLQPILSVPSSIRPEQPVALNISETNGREMTYVIAVVDEGLLDLTNFKTPDPHKAFYAREALGVKSFDLFDFVIGARGSDLERILTIGGDNDAGPVKQKTANRFKPVVKFLGPFHLNKGEKQTQRFAMPAYIGSVRMMVVAAQKGSYGYAEKNVAVKKPLMVLATLPRVLSPGETIQLPVTVFAMENSIRSVNVSLASNAFFDVLENPTQTISFTQTGEQMAYFRVHIKNATGIGKIKINVSSGAEKASDEVELDIRNPNPITSNIQQVTLAPGQQWTATAKAIGLPAQSTGMLEISSIPSMNLQKRLSYLVQYPHGCLEQTTSAIFPQLVLKQLTDLTEKQQADIDRNIKAGLARLQQFQRPDGGFNYWPGAGEPDDWSTSYAGHFLLEAQNNGYYVSQNMLSTWKNFQKGKANNWVPTTTNFYGGDLTQAYRLFCLALAKAPELGAMNRLKEFKYLSPEAKWRLAAAYQLAGQGNIALDLVSGLPVNFEQRINPGATFGSSLRDQAMVLETLTLMGNRKKAAAVLTSVAGQLSQDNWYSTQTTAYSLVAIAKYCGKNPSGEKIIASASISGVPATVNADSYLRQFPVAFTKGDAAVVIKNNGSNILYIRLISQGQPLTGDSTQYPSSPLLGMTVNYISQNGQPVDTRQLQQGSDFIARVTVKNTGKKGTYYEMALSQVFASGWEILNARMMEGEGPFKSSALEYQDIRDDRVYSYFDIRQNETLTYYVHLNAAYPGRYFLPATQCQAMYDAAVTAAGKGRWVDVLRP
jgi:alpha-2-macroglobulin